jgi:tRNA(adenine34) deaminase
MRIYSIIISLGLLLLAGCSSISPSSPRGHAPAQTEHLFGAPSPNLNAADERDEFYTLMAYAVVYKNWQTDSTSKGGRGHNIGSVLVDSSGRAVHWARNCNGVTSNGTQHGEVRLMTCYQAKNRLYNLKGYTIYTTLEPCAMCSGMMAMQSIARTVYGQTDLDFGKAIERLKLDSRSINGYKSYPRTENLVSNPAQSEVRRLIDYKFGQQAAVGNTNVTEWLRTNEAKEIYHMAAGAFENYEARNSENLALFRDAKKLFESVPAHPEESTCK